MCGEFIFVPPVKICMQVTIDPDRLYNSFETYATFGATVEDGLNRLALSDADGQARDQFCSDLQSLGLDITIDQVGNIFGRQVGDFSKKEPVLIGSHLDSQPSGGKYDGQLGIVVALEALRAIEEQSIVQERPVEIVNWTNEEGARFNLSPLGSGVFGGRYTVEEALAETDSDGVTVAEALADIDYDGEAPCKSHSINSHLELHIEQGPVLDREGVSVGVVDAGVGMTWLKVTIDGEPNHAGTTPMHARHDPLATATRVINEIQALPVEYANEVFLTTGEFEVYPNVVNVIPDEVVFTVDIRSPDDDTRSAVIKRVDRLLKHVSTNNKISYEKSELMSIESTTFSPDVRKSIVSACKGRGVDFEHLISGAGHDAMCLAEKTETGMIFVPSVDGISHTAQEYTKWEDILAGARVFADTTCRLACHSDM